MLILAAIALAVTANAQEYKCPDFYPVLSSIVPRLANATVYFGEPNGGGAMHGDIEEVQGGVDIHYGFPDGMPRWLVCQYGGKRTDGTAITPAQVQGGRDWWLQLDPAVDVCDLKIRETGTEAAGRAWSAVANCKGKPLPPPELIEQVGG